jgi:hypothetical protein
MHLRPGNYNIEIREGGRTQFSERVYVAAGKTLHLHPGLYGSQAKSACATFA